ncbi:MAG: tRNA pseudouridine(55) synthase TruB [Candidatus Dormibacteraeota bacterium]|nr:tRNA pseudouridine(55) synthase TruB [Candidatus Dormibacteraeota bacterium]
MPPLLRADVAQSRRAVSQFPTGVLNVDKAAGDTSFAVVNRLRRLTGAHRVGHAGTLDPLATGVLPILFESATRLSEFALKLPKTYVADICLGFTTATDDAEAELQPVGDPGGLNEADVLEGLSAFSGRILQEPPAFSAVKVDGQRAYKLARRGDEPKPRAREVEVYESRLLSFTPGPNAVARVEITCGSGTYLRSIARDLGRGLGVGGYLGRLVRTAYGGLKIASAVPEAELTSADVVRDRLLPAEVILPDMERVQLNVEQEAMVRQGRTARVFPEPGPGMLRAHDSAGRLVALGHADPLRRTFVPDKVLS